MTKPQERLKPFHGKGYNFAARITHDTREALQVEADRTGRSVASVAETWLELAREFNATKRLRELTQAAEDFAYHAHQQHKSMCPANTCTCGVTQEFSQALSRFNWAMLAAGQATKRDG